METESNRPQLEYISLGVDGTPLDLAETPAAVTASADLVGVLERLSTSLDGALALISRRTIVELDRLFAPLTSAGLTACTTA